MRITVESSGEPVTISGEPFSQVPEARDAGPAPTEAPQAGAATLLAAVDAGPPVVPGMDHPLVTGAAPSQAPIGPALDGGPAPDFSQGPTSSRQPPRPPTRSRSRRR